MAGLRLADITPPASRSAPPVSRPKRPGSPNPRTRSARLLSDRQKEGLYQELGTLLSAGLDIKASLELLQQEQTKPSAAALLQELTRQVIAGAALSEAMQHQAAFTPYEYHSVALGEEIGSLPTVLSELARYYQQRQKQKRQLVGALSYPLLILATSLGAVGFMLTFIVPMFSEVFARFGGELPYLTRVIIQGAEALKAYGGMGLLLFAGLGFILYLSRHQPAYQRYTAQLSMKVPLMGKIIVEMQLARFCSAMALLTGAQVPLLRAVQLVRDMVRFYPIHHSLFQIEQDIIGGMGLHESLKAFPVYEARLVALMNVGEEVNQLPKFFGQLAEQYRESVAHRTSLLNTFLEPLMILFLGLVVGFILMAMYLPMFQLSTSIGG